MVTPLGLTAVVRCALRNCELAGSVVLVIVEGSGVIREGPLGGGGGSQASGVLIVGDFLNQYISRR